MKLKSNITTLPETQFSAEGGGRSLAEGKSLGLGEGEVRGSRQKALETARILKQFGDSVQRIVQVTGLTVQEVETLK